MGGPSCYIALRQPLSGDPLESLRLLLARMAMVSPYEDTGNLEVRADLEGVGGCVFVGVEDPRDEDAAAFADRVESAAGWRPAHVISAFSMNRAPVNHGWLGRVAMEIAGRQDGLIHLLTICINRDQETAPPFTPELKDELERYRATLPADDRDLFDSLVSGVLKCEAYEAWSREFDEWAEAKVREHIATAPGRALECRGDDGDMWYLVDAEYMKAWLDNPDFFIE